MYVWFVTICKRVNSYGLTPMYVNADGAECLPRASQEKIPYLTDGVLWQKYITLFEPPVFT